MTSAIVLIVLGFVIWKLLPSWISFKSKDSRETVQMICNIIGIALLLFGIVDLVLCVF